MKLALLTSNQIRHQYVAHALAANHDLLLIVAEDKGNESQMLGETSEETEILSAHFSELQEVNTQYFSDISGFPGSAEVLHVPRGAINDHTVVKALQDNAVEGIAVFGCGILHENVFRACHGKVVNIHQGLSPYYRGSGTNFWPFVNGELECVGVTVHYIDHGIDTGGIICHGRPDIRDSDSLHLIGCKTIEVSANLLSRVFLSMDHGHVPASIPQWSKGRYYRRKDFNADAVISAQRKIAQGLVTNYVQNRNRCIQLINWT